ncbi:MAG: peroxiredoxin [Deltaproteobacteria bacterium]|nr:peroxiredoxin [Deltaproteobacteria bacterium]
MLKVGDTAPDFTLKDQDNNEVTLSKLRGQNVVLVFYPLAFSGICTSELKSITANQKKYDDAKAKVFGISIDSRYALAAYKRDEGLSATLLADFHPKGDVAKKYDVFMENLGFAKRGTFIIDKNGVIRGMTVNEPGQARDEKTYFDALASCPI